MRVCARAVSRIADEHGPAVCRARVEHSGIDAVQVRQAARLPAGLGHVSRKAARLRRPRAGPRTHPGISAVGRLGMPLTVERYEQSVSAPPLCEQLRIRDLLEDVAVQIDGSLVAGYEVGGIQSYYASDEGRNRLKGLLEALLRSLPERSMRMQMRFEISEGTGDLVSRYIRERRTENQVLRELDRLHIELWRSQETAGFYLQHFLHLYFIWNPRIHHESPDFEWKRKMKSSGGLSLSAAKCIERSRGDHEELLSEFNSLLAGVEATLQATGMSIRRMTHRDVFIEIKRSLHPLGNDTLPYRAE